MTTTTLGGMTDNIRCNAAPAATPLTAPDAPSRPHSYRISWDAAGTPYLQVKMTRHVGPGVWETSGWQTERVATRDDLAAMRSGHIGYDPETEPGALAWREHVEDGGD